MESLLVKTLNSQDNSTELQFMEKVYSDDVDIEMLTTKMEILKVLLKDGDFLCLDDIIVSQRVGVGLTTKPLHGSGMDNF